MRGFIQIVNNYIVCIRARLKWIFTLVWATLIGLLVANKGLPPLFPFLAALAISFCSAAGVYVYNDAMEYELDRINKVDRPVAKGEVSRNRALSLVLLLFFINVVLAASLNFMIFSLSGVFWILGFLYSTPPPFLKKRFPLKNTVPPAGAAISNLMGGAAVGNIPASLLYSSSLFFTLIFALSSVGDLTDYKGDETIGVETIVVRYGPEFTMKLSGITFLIVSAITIVSYSFFGFNILAPILITTSSLSMAWICFSLRKNWHDPEYCFATHKRIVLLLSLFQISFFIGVL